MSLLEMGIFPRFKKNVGPNHLAASSSIPRENKSWLGLLTQQRQSQSGQVRTGGMSSLAEGFSGYKTSP